MHPKNETTRRPTQCNSASVDVAEKQPVFLRFALKPQTQNENEHNRTCIIIHCSHERILFDTHFFLDSGLPSSGPASATGHAEAAAEADNDFGFVDPPATSAAAAAVAEEAEPVRVKTGGKGRRVSLMNFDSQVILLLVSCDVPPDENRFRRLRNSKCFKRWRGGQQAAQQVIEPSRQKMKEWHSNRTSKCSRIQLNSR